MTEAPKPHILVCDDELEVREMLGEYLERRGFQVSVAEDVPRLREILAAETLDGIILDINMPGEDGLTALRALRAENDIPVLMLTATADVVDRILGLEMGADDYLGKPVDLRELEARLKSVLRRTGPSQPPGKEASAAQVRFGTCLLDLEAATLQDAEGNEIAITAMEFSLLKVFAENQGRVLNRDQLLEQATTVPGTPSTAPSTSASPACAARLSPTPANPRLSAPSAV